MKREYLTLENFKEKFKNHITLKHNIVDICFYEVKTVNCTEVPELKYRVNELTVKDIKSFLKQGLVLCIREQINHNPDDSLKKTTVREYFYRGESDEQKVKE